MKYACLYPPPPEINSKWWREWGKEPKRERKETRRASFWKSDCSPICGPEIEKPWNTAAMRRMAGRVGWGPWGEHRANNCRRRWLQSWEQLREDDRGKLDEWSRPWGQPTRWLARNTFSARKDQNTHICAKQWHQAFVPWGGTVMPKQG